MNRPQKELPIRSFSEKLKLAMAQPSLVIKKSINMYKLFVQKDDFVIAHHRWVNDNGDDTRRFEYPLNPESIVFDLGGYKGDFAHAINERFACNVYLYEPVKEFYEQCVQRFRDNPKIRCFNFGLSDRDGQFYISHEDNASSIVKNPNLKNGEQVTVKSFVAHMKELNVSFIDLLKINIEGGEYQVIPHILINNLIKQIRYLQIQFHNFIENAEVNRDQIRLQLATTHDEMWNYTFVWESWRLK